MHSCVRPVKQKEHRVKLKLHNVDATSIKINFQAKGFKKCSPTL